MALYKPKPKSDKDKKTISDIIWVILKVMFGISCVSMFIFFIFQVGHTEIGLHKYQKLEELQHFPETQRMITEASEYDGISRDEYMAIKSKYHELLKDSVKQVLRKKRISIKTKE